MGETSCIVASAGSLSQAVLQNTFLKTFDDVSGKPVGCWMRKCMCYLRPLGVM